MRRASVIERDSTQITTIKNLTGVFESVASTHVAKVKNKVSLSEEFFQLLWSRYKAIQIDPKKLITNRSNEHNNGRKAFIIISAESGLSGTIDQRLIETMLQNFDEKTTDIIVLGSHGANQLTQRGIPFKRYFQVPESDKYIDVSPVVEAIMPYSQVIVYYEVYVSLGSQEIKSIDLISNIRDMSEDVAESENNSSIDEDTIFEPSLEEIAYQMEATMMTLALSQTILESSLAQAASRFSAMTVAKKRALDLLELYRFEFYHSKRAEGDKQLREIMTTLKKKKRHAGGAQ